MNDVPVERPFGIRKRRWLVAGTLLEAFFAKHGGQEATFGRLCAYVAGGGYITDLCADECVDRGVLMAVIRENGEWSRRYEKAVADRKAIEGEDVHARWSDVMNSEPAGLPDWGHVLKASELKAKSVGVLRDGPGNVNVNVGGGSLIAILAGMEPQADEPDEGEQHRVIDVSPSRADAPAVDYPSERAAAQAG